MEVRQHHHPHRRCLGRRAWASCCRGDAIVVKQFFNAYTPIPWRTHGLRAMTGAPWPPGSLDSSRRGQTCRVVFVGQMTSRRSGESPRDRIGTARPSRLTETEAGPKAHTHPGACHQRGRADVDTDTADSRHAHQPQGRPRTQTLPRSLTYRSSSTRLESVLDAVARGCSPLPPNTKRSPSILPVNVVPMSGVGSGYRTHSSHRTESQTIVGPKPLTRGLDRDHFQSAPLGKGIR